MTQERLLSYVDEAIAVAKDARDADDLASFCAAVQLAAELLQIARLLGRPDRKSVV